ASEHDDAPVCALVGGHERLAVRTLCEIADRRHVAPGDASRNGVGDAGLQADAAVRGAAKAEHSIAGGDVDLVAIAAYECGSWRRELRLDRAADVEGRHTDASPLGDHAGGGIAREDHQRIAARIGEVEEPAIGRHPELNAAPAAHRMAQRALVE